MWLTTLVIGLDAVAVAQALALRRPQTSSAADGARLPGLTRRGPAGGPATDINYELDGPGFWRFEWVANNLKVGDRLARSSAPHYNCKDCDQRLTPASIDFLKQQKITHVISLNNEASSRSIKRELLSNNIAYTALPTADFHAPTLSDLKRGYDAFKEHRKGTLIWCGYGHGRTGVMVSAIQVFSNSEKLTGRKMTHYDFKENHVETPDQLALLDELQKSVYNPPGRGNARINPLSIKKMWADTFNRDQKSQAKEPPQPAAAQPPPAPPKPPKGKPKSFGDVFHKPLAKLHAKLLPGPGPGQLPALKPSRDGAKKVGDLTDIPSAARPDAAAPARPGPGQLSTSKDFAEFLNRPAAKPDAKAPKVVADFAPGAHGAAKAPGSGELTTMKEFAEFLNKPAAKPDAKTPKVVAGFAPGSFGANAEFLNKPVAKPDAKTPRVVADFAPGPVVAKTPGPYGGMNPGASPLSPKPSFKGLKVVADFAPGSLGAKTPGPYGGMNPGANPFSSKPSFNGPKVVANAAPSFFKPPGSVAPMKPPVANMPSKQPGVPTFISYWPPRVLAAS